MIILYVAIMHRSKIERLFGRHTHGFDCVCEPFFRADLDCLVVRTISDDDILRKIYNNIPVPGLEILFRRNEYFGSGDWSPFYCWTLQVSI